VVDSTNILQEVYSANGIKQNPPKFGDLSTGLQGVHIPEDRNLNTHEHENLRSQVFILSLGWCISDHEERIAGGTIV
jgi:hypothetical protein